MTSKGRTFDLAKVIESELGKAKPLDIKVGERTITIPNPIFWPDRVWLVGDVASLRMLLSDEDYAAYTEAGGTARLFFSRIVPDWQGATVPESQASTDS